MKNMEFKKESPEEIAAFFEQNNQKSYEQKL